VQVVTAAAVVAPAQLAGDGVHGDDIVLLV